MVEPTTFEHHREPFGVGEPTPRLSWIIGAGRFSAGVLAETAGTTALVSLPGAEPREVGAGSNAFITRL